MTTKRIFAAFIIAASTLAVSCKKDNKEPEKEPENPAVQNPSYTVPSTYDFGSNASFAEATSRLGMMKEIVTYIRSTHNATAHVVIDAAKLKDMYSNSGSPFADASLNASGLNLREKTRNENGAQQEFEKVFEDAAAASQSTVEGSNGTAGKVLGPVPSNPNSARAAYLLDDKGFEFKELFEKGAMGAILYAEATTILKNIGGYDNSSAVAGEGTAMEHAWDLAFGYFGVPVNFPANTTGLSYWGNYCNSVNSAINSNSTIMDAFLKGRAAISNKDNAARDAARDVVVATWEKVAAAKLVAYLKQAKTNFASDGQRSHALSEALGFIKAFRYNPSKTISDADIDLLLGYIGDNLYTISIANIDLAINKVSTVFSLDASKL